MRHTIPHGFLWFTTSFVLFCDKVICLSRDIFTERTCQQIPQEADESAEMCSSENQSTFELLMPRGSRKRSFVLHFLCFAVLQHPRTDTFSSIQPYRIRICFRSHSRLPRNVRRTDSKHSASDSRAGVIASLSGLVMAFRVQEILDKELFVALDTTEEALRLTCKDAFGIDPSKGFTHKRELAKVVKA